MIQWHRVLNVLVVDVFPFSWPASQLSSLTHASYTHRLDVRGLAWSQKRTNKQANKKLRTRNKQSASQRETDNSTEKTGCLLHTMEKHRYKHVCYPLLLKFGLLVKQGESEKKKNRRTTTTRTHEKGGKKKRGQVITREVGRTQISDSPTPHLPPPKKKKWKSETCFSPLKRPSEKLSVINDNKREVSKKSVFKQTHAPTSVHGAFLLNSCNGRKKNS